jgi:predicted transcriptional regulator
MHTYINSCFGIYDSKRIEVYTYIIPSNIDTGMKYRDRNEIIAQILESANGNKVTLTKIMHDGYLSHAVTKEYLMLLIEKGLIEYLDGERTFKTTEKGMNFLQIISRVKEFSLITTKLQGTEEMVSYL